MPRARKYQSEAERKVAWRNRRDHHRDDSPIIAESLETSRVDATKPEISPIVAEIIESSRGPVIPAVSTRQSLRDRLAALEAQYRAAQRACDWPCCRRVNDEREPLFGELWELERALPESERYWFPARIINQGEGFAVKR